MNTTIGTILTLLLNTTISLITIFGTMAFVVFFYGLALFLFNRESKNINERGKNIMVWGTIALFVLISLWGIIGFMQRSLGTTGGPAKPVINLPVY